jgi:hypothetical protein
MSKYTTRKYNGDDCYSWAVFKASDVKGIRGVVFCGQARPVACGLDRQTAQDTARRFTEEAK